jgi:hypothetical protein
MGFLFKQGGYEMKKIIIAIIVISCFLAFIPSSRAIAEESATMKFLLDGVTDLVNGIKSHSNSDLNIGKVFESYRFNKKYLILGSDGSYKGIPCILLTTYDEKTKMVYYVGYDKSNKDDMKELYDFNQMNLKEKRLYLKKTFLSEAKFDLGEIEAEPSTSAQPAPVSKQEQTSTTAPASK